MKLLLLILFCLVNVYSPQTKNCDCYVIYRDIINDFDLRLYELYDEGDTLYRLSEGDSIKEGKSRYYISGILETCKGKMHIVIEDKKLKSKVTAFFAEGTTKKLDTIPTYDAQGEIYERTPICYYRPNRTGTWIYTDSTNTVIKIEEYSNDSLISSTIK